MAQSDKIDDYFGNGIQTTCVIIQCSLCHFLATNNNSFGSYSTAIHTPTTATSALSTLAKTVILYIRYSVLYTSIVIHSDKIRQRKGDGWTIFIFNVHQSCVRGSLCNLLGKNRQHLQVIKPQHNSGHKQLNNTTGNRKI